ncbi:MAG: cysteine hydrolase [bacterium]|nr:cysteine hydrolase [bacterium]
MKNTKTALLVIDCQKYFFDPASPAYLPASKRVLPRVNKLIALAQARKWPAVLTVHGPSYSPGNLMLSQWRHLPKGRQCELHQDLKVPGKAKIIHKQHYSAFIGTGLEKYLKKQGVGRVVLCGAMTHLCVDTTARHAFMLGFQPVIVRDACCSKSPDLHKAALLALKHGFAKTISMAEITKEPTTETRKSESM